MALQVKGGIRMRSPCEMGCFTCGIRWEQLGGVGWVTLLGTSESWPQPQRSESKNCWGTKFLLSLGEAGKAEMHSGDISSPGILESSPDPPQQNPKNPTEAQGWFWGCSLDHGETVGL